MKNDASSLQTYTLEVKTGRYHSGLTESDRVEIEWQNLVSLGILPPLKKQTKSKLGNGVAYASKRGRFKTKSKLIIWFMT
jgi:hypothetical protein